MTKRHVSGPLLTEASMREKFLPLLGQGETVLVHSALGRLGWVCGGAPAVVRALLDVVGPDGTLVVPAHTANNREPATWTEPVVPMSWWNPIREHLPAFDGATTPSFRMGLIAECIRTWPGSVRSAHPQVSFAAIGAKAAKITADHPLECHLGESSPLRRLEDADARVLLLGVGWEACTAFHLAEYRQATVPMREYSCVISVGGQRRWVKYEDVVLDDHPFQAMGASFEQQAAETSGIRSVSLGAGRATIVPIRTAVAFATLWLARRSANSSVQSPP